MATPILGNGKTPVLAKPLTDPANVPVQEYGDVIDELVLSNSLPNMASQSLLPTQARVGRVSLMIRTGPMISD